MEDITGFEEQIGASFFSVLNKAIKKPIQAATTAKKSFFNRITKQTPKGAAIDKNIAMRISKGMPIPAKIKTAIVKRQATGKSLPPAIKQAMAIKKSTPKQGIFKRLTNQVKTMPVKTMPVRSMPVKSMPITAKLLTMVTNPTAVKRANPVQRSFMPVDLPYKNFAPKTKRLKIPATNFSLTTDIDLIQPSVDGGTSNYYGK